MYAYCDNNPVMRVDGDGEFWDTFFDVVSLAFSVAEVVANPYDVGAWVGLIGDTIDLIPFVSGVGEATDLIRVVVKGDKALDTAKSISQNFTKSALIIWGTTAVTYGASYGLEKINWGF